MSNLSQTFFSVVRMICYFAGGSVTASFGYYRSSGTMYVVLDLHGKNGHVDPELCCRTFSFFLWTKILWTKFLEYNSKITCVVPDLHGGWVM